MAVSHIQPGPAPPAGADCTIDAHVIRSPRAMPQPTPVSDVAAVRHALIAAAQAGEAVSYAGLLGDLGHRFTRPLMRALCKTLDMIDEAGAAAGAASRAPRGRSGSYSTNVTTSASAARVVRKLLAG
jgi:hypothetical protein